MSTPSPSHATGVVHGNALVVTVAMSEIRDTLQAYALRDEIIALIDAFDAQNVVLDLQQVQFIGSIGFLAFLGVRRHLVGGRIVLCHLSDAVEQMFAVCKLISTSPSTSAPFETAPTLETATALLAA